MSCVSHFKQAFVVFIPALLSMPFQFYPLLRSQLILLIRFFISLLYVKPVVSIHKQFSIDSFLDWEGHHWNISFMTLISPLLAISAFCPHLLPHILFAKVCKLRWCQRWMLKITEFLPVSSHCMAWTRYTQRRTITIIYPYNWRKILHHLVKCNQKFNEIKSPIWTFFVIQSFFACDLLRFWSLGYPAVRGLGWQGDFCKKSLPWVGVEACTKFGGDL